ncbi:hypothetical protein B0A48_11428 [Cryoendolithus antarcticus]|uniref:UDP-galactose transporter homolog 1 n=1 Tax=Cryoendolithus antarcticus TaxID=1507870 RepID=A0A1V8SVJ7_9PEZI|nr:hypothetical protein B0A48_11428 [Cryoendolithus antarcticus]
MATNGSVHKGKTSNGHVPEPVQNVIDESRREANMPDSKPQGSLTQLVICVSGIYAAFLTWGILQERITTTQHGPPSAPEVFRYPLIINTTQSIFATLLAYVYNAITRSSYTDKPIFPSRAILYPLCLVALTSALASPFGYASLAHVDYITFILAKSCKLVPVMGLHVVLYGKRYPWQKYAVVALVTLGVAVFTLHQPSKKKSSNENSIYGLTLLGINLIFDGLTNSTQDHVNARFRPYSGPQMMCALNLLQTFLTGTWLVVAPYIALTGVGHYVGMDLGGAEGEWAGAVAFVGRHPSVAYDVLGFAICGAVGQLFIFYTLSVFGSLFLVTVTVTRKMLTMIISVLWFGHRLSAMQWVGVGCVFGGIAIEAELGKREKAAKERAKGKKVM